MADYKVTDAELTAVANAIRTKGGTSLPLEWPDGYISAINAIPSPVPEIVSWAEGTDAQIAAMVAALDNGTLTIEETGWQIGDEREVSLSAMPATGVNESHAAQIVKFVLMDSQHYNLVGGGKDHFVVGLKTPLNERGYMNASNTNTGAWDGCLRRTWCNGVFRMSIPEDFRNCFKQFECLTAETASGSTNIISNDYFALFAEKELFGGQLYSNVTEANALSQIEYFKTSGRTNAAAWDRGPFSTYGFCCTDSQGSRYANQSTMNYGISPFGCI